MRQGLPESEGTELRLSAIQAALSLDPLVSTEKDSVIGAGFASDVLSEVLASAPRGCVLVTVQTHVNVVAVASYVGVAAVIVTCGRTPASDVLARAREEGVAMYSTPLDTFDVVGKLSQLGLRGYNPRVGAR